MQDCALTNSTGAGLFTIIDAKHYFPGVAQDVASNIKKLQQKLKPVLKCTINQNEYQQQVSTRHKNKNAQLTGMNINSKCQLDTKKKFRLVN